MFNHKHVIIDSFKHCKLTITTDGSEDLLIHCLKPNQPCSASFAGIKGLSYEVPQERHDLLGLNVVFVYFVYLLRLNGT